MIGWLKCMFGAHAWKESEHEKWGETIKVRTCQRCGTRRRWLPDILDPGGQSGWWVRI